VRRFALLALAATVAAVVAASAHGALFFLFTPRSAEAGQLVTVRLGGTPPGFTLVDRQKPFGKPMRIYLVPNRVADEVTSRFDPRLHFVGSLIPDRDTHGLLSFRAPPLDSGTYVVAAWCPGCATYSRGQRFFVLAPAESSRYRNQMALRLELPPVAAGCPVTRGRYENGILATSVPGA
jgi:hypothetical protein